MPNPFESLIIEPVPELWSDWLSTSRSRSVSGRLPELQTSGRRRLIESAEQFVVRLHRRATECGLPAVSVPLLTGDPLQVPLIMTGHQPVIFHPGLACKYSLTEQFARRQQAVCVAVVIDSDHGDCGQFFSVRADPEATGTGSSPGSLVQPIPMQLISKSITAGPGLYLNSVLKDAAEIHDVCTRVVADLRLLSLSVASLQAESVLRQYANLSGHGVSGMEANLLMRWQYGIGASCLELPLTAISAFPEMLSLTAEILARGEEFCAMYNQLLDQFRADNRIRNAANPFPSLGQSSTDSELPFWVLMHKTQRRHSLRVRRTGEQLELLADQQSVAVLDVRNLTDGGQLEPLLLNGIQLVPRGALITALLRLLFSDLFVHGTGGGKYDRFTDMLIREWWHVSPSPFAVASGSRYLLTESRRELLRLEQLSGMLRDLQFNPQRSFDSGLFFPALEQRLKQLTAEKQSAIDRMRAAHAGGSSARLIGREIQQLTDQIKMLVSTEFQPSIQRLQAVSPQTLEAISCRTFPWFYFDDWMDVGSSGHACWGPGG